MQLHNEIQVGKNTLYVLYCTYVCTYANVEELSNFSFPIVCTVQDKVTENSGSISDRLLLSHSEAQVTYRCLLSAEGLESVSVNVTSRPTVVLTQPDTAYNIKCLGYSNQGRDLCREQKMSIITRECIRIT